MNCDCGSCGNTCCPHDANCTSQQVQPSDPSDDYGL